MTIWRFKGWPVSRFALFYHTKIWILNVQCPWMSNCTNLKRFARYFEMSLSESFNHFWWELPPQSGPKVAWGYKWVILQTTLLTLLGLLRTYIWIIVPIFSPQMWKWPLTSDKSIFKNTMENKFSNFFSFYQNAPNFFFKNRNMDLLISKLLSESIFDFKKLSNWKYANARIFTSQSQILIPKAVLKGESPYFHSKKKVWERFDGRIQS